MIWGAFSAHGKAELSVLRGKQDSVAYCYTIETYLLPFANYHYGDQFIYQQDNASIHSFKFTRDMFTDHRVEEMDWPSRSPDLNRMENQWSKLVRIFYAEGKQYNSANELKNAIFDAWNSISLTYLQTLVASMNDRCFEVIRHGGL
jgi:hypothetical protein